MKLCRWFARRRKRSFEARRQMVSRDIISTAATWLVWRFLPGGVFLEFLRWSAYARDLSDGASCFVRRRGECTWLRQLAP